MLNMSYIIIVIYIISIFKLNLYTQCTALTVCSSETYKPYTIIHRINSYKNHVISHDDQIFRLFKKHHECTYTLPDTKQPLKVQKSIKNIHSHFRFL